MAGASNCIQTKAKENVCLFCGEPVEKGLLKEYKGITVWICTQCIMEGELGSLMATAILDKLQVDELKSSLPYRREVLSEIERSLVTTQANYYRTILYGPQTPIRIAEKSSAQKAGELEEPGEFDELTEEMIEVEDERGHDFPDEHELLEFLDTWRSFEEIQAHFEADYEPLLDMLNNLFLRGYIFKRGPPQNPQYCNTLIA